MGISNLFTVPSQWRAVDGTNDEVDSAEFKIGAIKNDKIGNGEGVTVVCCEDLIGPWRIASKVKDCETQGKS